MKKYKYWEVYEVLPIGWKVDNSCGSPLSGYDFCTDGKSILNGGKRALVRTIRKGTPRIEYSKKEVKKSNVQKMHVTNSSKEENYIFPAKKANTLARKKFQEHLLKEILFDLMVCEIEGWDKKEYINEIKKLINGIDTSNKKKINSNNIPDLFSGVVL